MFIPTVSMAKPADADRLQSATRPREIEEWTNLFIVHPVSRRLASGFIATGVSANAVSVMGATMSILAACSYAFLAWPLSAVLAFAGLIAAHMFDGADGLVARATAQQSTRGEIVNSLCDHSGFGAVYLALGFVAYQQIGWTGPVLALLAALSNIVQANAYEGQRRTYGHWIYGKNWIGTLDAAELAGSIRGPFARLAVPLARLYVWVYQRTTAEHPQLDRLMAECRAEGGNAAARSRFVYGDWKASQVRRWSILGQNPKTIAMGLAMICNRPELYFLFVVAFLNPVLIGFIAIRSQGIEQIIERLQAIKSDSQHRP